METNLPNQCPLGIAQWVYFTDSGFEVNLQLKLIAIWIELFVWFKSKIFELLGLPIHKFYWTTLKNYSVSLVNVNVNVNSNWEKISKAPTFCSSFYFEKAQKLAPGIYSFFELNLL